MPRAAFGHIQKHRNTGKWRVFWHENDKLRSKVVPTKNEAIKLLSKQSLLAGAVDTTITYTNYYNSVIHPTFKHLSKRTAYDYDYTWSKIKPHIGNKKIADTTWLQIQNVIDQFNGAKMQQNIFVLWRKILNFAVRDNIIVKNPCNKNIKRKPIERKEKRLYTNDELRKVLLSIKNTEFAIPVLLETCCGLRHEEYCALNKRDFDFTENGWVHISISKALTEVAGNKVLKKTKTSTSERLVTLHEDFKDYLLEHASYLTNKRTLKDYPYPNGLTKRWKRYCDNNNIPYVNFGSMRSVYATLCAEAGCVDSIVGKSMGHTGATIKEKNYQSATVRALKLNAEVLAEYIAFKNLKTKD